MKRQKGIFAPVWLRFLLFLAENDDVYIIKAAKRMNYTYSHVHDVAVALEKQRVITFEKQGRKQYIRLTKRGEAAVQAVVVLEKVVSW